MLREPLNRNEPDQTYYRSRGELCRRAASVVEPGPRRDTLLRLADFFEARAAGPEEGPPLQPFE
jgi:hypothetical protein